jgi:hypothetical protein
LFDPNKVPEADLRRYDLNVVAHWQAITAQRNKLEGHELQMKYFQYLSLLFTELYLDWYFNHRQDLLDGLNEEMALPRRDGAEPFRDFEADDLNKIAFWNATGSGKTLLLHVNIRQYLHYFQAGRRAITTPTRSSCSRPTKACRASTWMSCTCPALGLRSFQQGSVPAARHHRNHRHQQAGR